MNLFDQKKLLSEIKSFFVKWYGSEDELADTAFLTGPDAVEMCDYAAEDRPGMTFEGTVCHDLYYGMDKGKLLEAFNAFLKEKGLFFEFGNIWNLSIYPIGD